MPKFTIDLGSKVKSRISGFQGIVVTQAEHLNGCNRYAVQPSIVGDMKLPDSYFFDEAELEVIESSKFNIKEINFLFNLGIEAKSNISGLLGIIVSRAKFYGGYNKYWISPKVDKDGKLSDGVWIEEGEVEIVSPSKLEKKNPDRGGPPSRLK